MLWTQTEKTLLVTWRPRGKRPMTPFVSQVPKTLHYKDDLLSYLVSNGGACDSLLGQADCGPVLLPGCLYTIPFPSCLLPGPGGHLVKHFLDRCQDSWQIEFFLLTGTRIKLRLLIPLQECTLGFSRNKSTTVNGAEMKEFLLFVFWDLQVTDH